MKLNQIVKLYFDDTYLVEKAGERGGGVIFEGVIANHLKKRGAEIWATPAGSDAGWPDIGASIKLETGEIVHLHIEAKTSRKDPMGSVRKWHFNGTKFTIPNTEEGQDNRVLLSVMNTAKEAKKNAKFILSEIKRSVGVKFLSNKTWTSVVGNNEEKFGKLLSLLKVVKPKLKGEKDSAGMQIARIESGEIGALIVKHYQKKFKARAGGKNVLMFALGNELFFMPGPRLDSKTKKKVEDWFGVEKIPDLPKTANGSLEIRIQARSSTDLKNGLKGKFPKKFKRSYLDVNATLRWKGLPKGVKFLSVPAKKELKQKGPALGTLGADTTVPERQRKVKPNS